jgi:uncharacterized membrane protein
MDLSIQRSPVIKFRLHIIIGTLLLIVFILIIARITDSGTPKTRTNIWGIVVVSYLPTYFLVSSWNSLTHDQSASNQLFLWHIKS